jgi:hypothetical protein
MAGFSASLEFSLSLEQMEFCRNFLSTWIFVGILFGRLLARIPKYLLTGSPTEVNKVVQDFEPPCVPLVAVAAESSRE